MDPKPRTHNIFELPNETPQSSAQPGAEPLQRDRDLERREAEVAPGTEYGGAAAAAVMVRSTPSNAPNETRPGESGGSNVGNALFDKSVADDLQARWNEIQAAFVDEPRSAVERADNLVEEVTKRLTNSFATGRRMLESEWNQGSNPSTESLRLALQHYRSFFNRLLAI